MATDSIWRRLLRPIARSFTHGHAVPLIVLTLCHLAVFGRLLFANSDGAMPAHVPWDFNDTYHRFLVYISDSLRAGALPTWYPYGSAGSPFFTNPQSQLWSPVTWVGTLLFGYTHDVAQRQLVMTVLLGGFGTYALGLSFWNKRTPALISAVAYMLAGHTLTNMSHMDIVHAFALLPWLFWAPVRILDRGWRSGPLFSLLIALALTWCYPGVIAMAALWVIAWTVYIAMTRTRPGRARRAFALQILVAGAVGVLAAGGYWISLLSSLGTFTRGEGLAVSYALSGNLGLKHLLGYVFPYVTSPELPGHTPNITMTGVYFGIVTLPLVAIGVAFRRDRLTAILTGTALITSLLATGALFPPRYFLNTIIPVLNLSRFPAADSRGLAILALCLLAGAGATCFTEQLHHIRRFAMRTCAALAVMALLAPLVLRFTSFSDIGLPQFNDTIVGPAFAQVLLLVAGLLWLRRAKSGHEVLQGWTVLIVCDLMLASVCVAKTFIWTPTPEERQATATLYDPTFKVENAKVPRRVGGTNLQDFRSTHGYVGKVFYLSDLSPFRLKAFDALLSLGFQDWLTNGARVVGLPPGSRTENAAAFAARIEPLDFEIVSYLPDRVTYRIETAKPTLLVFNEVYFPGWRAGVDGQDQPMNLFEPGLRSLEITAGRHTIETYFRPRAMVWGAAVSLTGWVLWLAWIAWAALAAFRQRHRPSASSLL